MSTVRKGVVNNGVQERYASAIELSDDDTSERASPQRDTNDERPEIGSDWESDDGASDNESLIIDILNADRDQVLVQTNDLDCCTSQESQSYRRRLREISLDDFIAETISSGKITAKKLLTAFGVNPPAFLDGRGDSAYYRLLGLCLLQELSTRIKLPQYNTIDDAADLLKKSSNIIVITGAGISTNLGIPDFRSKNTGFYAKMRERGFDEPEEVFSLEMFEENPSIFYENCIETFPNEGVTTPTHAFIRMLQDQNKLLTNYTQNIDNIESAAGIRTDKLIQCHGSWATATCRKCGHKVLGKEILAEAHAGKVPKCPRCIETIKSNLRPGFKRKRSSNQSSRANSKKRGQHDDDSSDDGRYDIPEPGVMKPDITFFGEKLPDRFFDRFKGHDMHAADLVLVIGTSMKVAPVSEIPMALAPDIPHIYISRDPCKHIGFDITLLGDCDIVMAELSKRAGWTLEHEMLPDTVETIVEAYEERRGNWTVAMKPQSSAGGSPDARKAAEIRITLEANGHEDYDILVRPSTTFSKILKAFRKGRHVDAHQPLTLTFNNEFLLEDRQVEHSGLKSMDRIEVHFKKIFSEEMTPRES